MSQYSISGVVSSSGSNSGNQVAPRSSCATRSSSLNVTWSHGTSRRSAARNAGGNGSSPSTHLRLGDEPPDSLERIGHVESSHLVTEDTTNVTWTQPGPCRTTEGTSDEGGFHAPFPQMHAVYVRRRARDRRRAGGRVRRRRRDGVEPHRAEPDDPAPADGARGEPRHGDGRRSHVRRGQRDRPRPRALPPRRSTPSPPSRGRPRMPRRRPLHITCSSRSRPTPSTLRSTRRGTPRSTESHPTRSTRSGPKAFAPERPPRRRCSPSVRTTASWRRSTSRR